MSGAHELVKTWIEKCRRYGIYKHIRKQEGAGIFFYQNYVGHLEKEALEFSLSLYLMLHPSFLPMLGLSIQPNQS